MTIPRKKRLPRSTGRGRPKKASAPPKATGTTNILLNLFTNSALQEIASRAELSIVDDKILPQIVDFLDEAFSNFANSAAMKVADTPPSIRRDWCAGLVKATADLQTALGYSTTSLFFEQSSFDAHDILAKAWPFNPNSEHGRERRAELIAALQFALPEKFAVGSGSRSETDIDGDLLITLGRLGPMLRIVASVAQAAQDAWATEAASSEVLREHGRSYLMERVVLAYVCLFGRLPTASPSSAGHRWVAALIAHAGQVAGELLERLMHGESPDQQVTALALQNIKAIADHIRSPFHRTVTGGTAKLDHWIREAVASPQLQAAKAAFDAQLPS